MLRGPGAACASVWTSASTGAVHTAAQDAHFLSRVGGAAAPQPYSAAPRRARTLSQPRGAWASRGCPRKRWGTSSLTVPESRCSLGALTWSQRHTPISRSDRGQAVPAAGQAREERGRGRIQVVRGAWREGPQGKRRSGLGGPAGWLAWPGGPPEAPGPRVPRWWFASHGHRAEP